MAEQRPIWRGTLRLALVSCPVALYTANRDRGTLHFHLINPDTGNRVRMVTEDAETGKELSRSDLVKGFEFRKGEHVIVEEDDFAAARVESSSTIAIGKFVEAGSIDALYFDASYYLVPDGRENADVYAVLREAMKKSGKIALSRLVIGQRERPIVVIPLDPGMVVHTLHEDRDINNAKPLFEDIPKAKPDTEMVALATQLIDRQSGKYDASDHEDRYETRLRAIIDAKLKGKGVKPAEEEPKDRGNVVDLMDALRKSLGQKSEKPAAKAKPTRKAAAPARPKVRRRA